MKSIWILNPVNRSIIAGTEDDIPQYLRDPSLGHIGPKVDILIDAKPLLNCGFRLKGWTNQVLAGYGIVRSNSDDLIKFDTLKKNVVWISSIARD